MKKILKYSALSFILTQFIILYINVQIFHSFSSWLFGTVFGLTIGISMVGGQYFIKKHIKKRFPLLQNPIKNILLHFTIGTIYTIIVILLLNYIAWVLIFNVPYEQFIQSNWVSIKIAIIMYFGISLFVYSFIFYKNWRDLAMEQEKQRTESLRLRFEALRNHVNPHFLFNSLSSLTHLIEIDKDKAISFTNHLAETYRYIIEHKDTDLVTLDEEMNFVQSYLRLQGIRYGELIQINNRVVDNQNTYFVIPVSVQMLIENIFKHNEISRSSKIVIEIWIENDYLYIKNNINTKSEDLDRTPTGLANIRSRYEYLSNRICIFGAQENNFIVALPLLTSVEKKTMRAVVIEDEPLVSDYLVALIKKIDPTIEIIATLDTVKQSIPWFAANPAVDIAFMDIRLADGISFDIFEHCTVPCPVIFTTAYDEYAIRAFKVNSIDYLLKPIKQNDLENALIKFRNQSNVQSQFKNEQIIPVLKNEIKTGYKTRFVVKVGERLIMIPLEEIVYFCSKDKSTWICTTAGKEYPIEQYIDSLAECISPTTFFRINRKYFVSIHAIKDIIVYSGSRLLVKMPHCNNEDTIVSREKVLDFRKWIEG
ncbi:MAG: histidine kinase [Bacteroidales bacterium]|nr:histidine kinase [Bacteroidales bacterium]